MVVFFVLVTIFVATLSNYCNMNITKYLVILFLIGISFSACNKDDSKSPIMKRHSINDQFYMYVGDPEYGGMRVPVLDSLQNRILNNYFREQYATVRNNYLYKTMLFYGDKLTYVDEKQNKMISNYAIINDSLYTYKTGGIPVFVARTFSPDSYADSLYLVNSYIRYSALKDTAYILGSAIADNDFITLDKALEMSSFKSLNDMRKNSDTLMWWNAIYIFK